MKKKNPIITAFKAFFGSLGEDLKDLFKKHYLKLIGYIITYIVPLAYIIVMYLSKKPEKWTLPVFCWIPLIVLVIVYWSKIKSYLAIKVSKMETENSLQKGKHAGAIIICKTIQVIFTVVPFVICYFVFKAIRESIGNTEELFLFIAITMAIGGLFIILDTIKNVVDYDLVEDESDE